MKAIINCKQKQTAKTIELNKEQSEEIILFYEKLQDVILKKINGYINRPTPKYGYRYVRIPLDCLIAQRKFGPLQIIKEYELIMDKRSTLPRSLRDAIKVMIEQSIMEIKHDTSNNDK